jgi:tight adherence protein C
MQFNVALAIIGLIIGFFLLDLTIELSNNQDNKKISSDIVRVFDSLKIQICAGAYITNAIKESYFIAKNKRFKKALGELTSEITLTNDFENAIDKFNEKFNYKYVDTFCITLKQGNETGQINKILEDTSESIKEIERIIQKEDAKKVEMKSNMIQMMVYIGVLAVVIFGLFGEITTGISSM